MTTKFDPFLLLLSSFFFSFLRMDTQLQKKISPTDGHFNGVHILICRVPNKIHIWNATISCTPATYIVLVRGLWVPIMIKTTVKSSIKVLVISTLTPTLSHVDKDTSSLEKIYDVLIAEDSFQLITSHC